MFWWIRRPSWSGLVWVWFGLRLWFCHGFFKINRVKRYATLSEWILTSGLAFWWQCSRQSGRGPIIAVGFRLCYRVDFHWDSRRLLILRHPGRWWHTTTSRFHSSGHGSKDRCQIFSIRIGLFVFFFISNFRLFVFRRRYAHDVP